MTATRPDPTDAQLLTRYVADRDDRAFAHIVRKHGPMVFGACRRIAGRWHDAEDAFQACFLVLAAKAETVRPPSRLGAWLHGVAVRCALKARRLARAAAAAVPLPDLPAPDLPAVEPDLVPLLDEALAAIPDAYRAAVVLCHLQGRTRTEAARELGWTEGTLSGRLHRSLELLAKRLAARGVTATGAAVLATVSARTASAVLPAKLLASTNSAAALLSAGFPDASSNAATTLAHGVMRTMTFRKLKLAACLLLLSAGIGAFALENLAAAKPDAPNRVVRRNAPVPAEAKQAWKEVLAVKHDAALTAVAISKDCVVSADEASGIHIRVSDATTGESLRPQKVPGGAPSPDKPVRLMRILTDEKTLFFDGADSTVWKTDLSVKNGGGIHGTGPGKARYAAFSGDGKTWVTLPDLIPDTAILMHSWHDPVRPKGNVDVAFRDPLRRPLTHAALSADDKWLATANADAVLRVYDRATNKEVHAITLAEGTVLTALKLSDDGKRLAVVGEKGFAKLFDTGTGKEACELKGHDGTVNAVAFTPNGTEVVTANGKLVRAFDAKTGKLLGEIAGHAADVTALAYSPDGKRLVTGSKDKTAKVWERK